MTISGHQDFWLCENWKLKKKHNDISFGFSVDSMMLSGNLELWSVEQPNSRGRRHLRRRPAVLPAEAPQAGRDQVWCKHFTW